MNRLSKIQKERVAQFASIAGISAKVATDTLKGCDWNVEAAFEALYSSVGPGGVPSASSFGSSGVDRHRIEQWFLRYKDEHCDMILGEGVARLCEDLQVDPSDIATLVLSWHLDAATMCEFSRSEFVDGVSSLGADSVEKLRALLPRFRSELKDENKFREVYNFAFAWAKEKGQKSLALDTAMPMWRLLFSERSWPLVDQWCTFLQEHHNTAISRDTWTQLLEFARTIQPDLSNYDEGGAWPYLVDEFVDYLRKERADGSEGAAAALTS
eukprot:TRINITY_DN17384_c0_g1_i2.p2 TRINITY_DN17384_c0_g1~~TRINITY_DN17384_c0_g1_i2.p2  ORF type:complete len:269 (-),score=48.06 TRINITY_DN17384_c0_g1_i2:281-1087(-)